MTKTCIIQCCPNTEDNCGKLFIHVPKDEQRRQRWLDVAQRPFSRTTDLFCCEDHFELAEDAENWQYYKTMGGHLRLHKYVVPHRHIDKLCTSNQSQLHRDFMHKKAKINVLQDIVNTSTDDNCNECQCRSIEGTDS